MSDLIHKGHRQRMRRKFDEYGPRVFDTYELLEMLLYRTVSTKDTNPHAKKLLARFGSLEGVLSADVSELTEVDGVGIKTAELISAAGEALAFSFSNIANDAPMLDDYHTLGKFAVGILGKEINYKVLMILLDNAMRLISVETVCELDFSSGAVRPRPFIDTAIKSRASVAILAHNHPYGPICPSEGDLATNVLVENALSGVGIVLIDHYIVCGNDYIGFMSSNMNEVFAQKPAIGKFLRSKRGEMANE